MLTMYQKVTDKIVAQLEAGTMPWIRPWSATAGRNTPQNAITGRPYSGINTVLLWDTINHGFTVPRFLTFKQCNSAGGRVKKGQNGFKIYFVKKLSVAKSELETEETRNITMLREYTVFNISQCENLPESLINPGPAKVYNKEERIDLADEYTQSLGADIRHGSGEAYYAPGPDFVTIPDWESFHSQEAYYNVLFHELTHWTAHKSRLDRDLKGRFGQAAYAAEELIAELGAAFQCAEFGFDTTSRSSSYINSWIKLLKKDNRALFTAASKASKAVDYLKQKALSGCSTHPEISPTSPSIPQSELVNSSLAMSTRSIGPIAVPQAQ